MSAVMGRSEFRVLYTRIPDTLGGLRDRAMLRLLFTCGLRPSELIKIRVADIRGATIRVQSCHQGRRLESVPPLVHLMSVPEAAIRDIIRWLQAARIETGLVFRRIGKGGHVAETALTTTSVRRIVARYDYGNRGYNPRGLRKGFALDLALRGSSLSELRSRLRVHGPRSAWLVVLGVHQVPTMPVVEPEPHP